ncbi:MAG: Hpt domain-containing protein [Ignavibacteriales bacterium]|nr:Hpt domain-containing protein [Ignavibacteriales bacterium]
MNDDDRFYKDLAREFLTDIRGRIRDAMANPYQPNFDSLKMAGHKLKGTGPSLGLKQLAKQGAKLEEEIGDHATAKALQTVTTIMTLIEEHLTHAK